MSLICLFYLFCLATCRNKGYIYCCIPYQVCVAICNARVVPLASRQDRIWLYRNDRYMRSSCLVLCTLSDIPRDGWSWRWFWAAEEVQWRTMLDQTNPDECRNGGISHCCILDLQHYSQMLASTEGRVMLFRRIVWSASCSFQIKQNPQKF